MAGLSQPTVVTSAVSSYLISWLAKSGYFQQGQGAREQASLGDADMLLFMTIALQVLQVLQEHSNESSRKSLAAGEQQVCVWRQSKPEEDGDWEWTSSRDVCQGDLIALWGAGSQPVGAAAGQSEPQARTGRSDNRQAVAADVLLLRGSVSVDEAILTGESVPVHKEAPGMDSPMHGNGATGEHPEDVVLDAAGARERWVRKENASHIVFAGTTILAHASGSNINDDDTDDDEAEEAELAASTSIGARQLLAHRRAMEALSRIPVPPGHGATGFVLRTGFRTEVGALQQASMSGRGKASELEAQELSHYFWLVAAGRVSIIAAYLAYTVAAAFGVWQSSAPAT